MPPAPSQIETVGVDLGGTKMLVGVVDFDGQVVYRSLVSSHGLGEAQLVDLIERELGSALEARPEAVGIGLGVPATIDRERGIAIRAVNLDIADLPLRDLISDRVELPVFLDNDANAAAIGEHRFGAANGARNAVMLTLGTGVGGGLILEGRPYRGSIGAGAELGHMVVDLDGPRCQGNCPNRGCLEAVASGTALAQGAEFDGALVTDAALAGDDAARAVVATVGTRLGAGLSGLANIFDPDVIVVGGGVMAVGELLLGPARDELRARALPPMNEVAVVEAELGPDAGMIGAAAMAMAEVEEAA